MLLPESSVEERYRSGPLIRWRQGFGRELLYFPSVGVYKQVSSPVASALESWTSFRTIGEATVEIVFGMPSLVTDELATVLKELIDSGGLVSQSQIVSKSFLNPSAPEGCGIDWLAIPTCDRGESVSRAISTYADNIGHFGRRCGIFVSDDSRDEKHRAVCLEALASLDYPGLNVWYAGLNEKAAFAKWLAEKGDIPPDLIRFALFGSGPRSRTTGANRNAILFHTLGSRVLSVDDDTICDPAVLPNTNTELTVAGHWIPAEVWCFPTYSEATGFGTRVMLDVIGEHEKYLGKPIGNLLSVARQDRKLGSMDAMCTHMMSSLLSGLGQVRATFNGARGDSGYFSDLALIAHRSLATRRRIQDLGSQYREYVGSRQIARQAPSTTICHSDAASIGMYIGLDNASPLPPFLPDCRNQDGIFANIVGLLSDHHYVAHLPFTMAHKPTESRSYALDRDQSVRMSDLMLGCLSTWKPELGLSTSIKRLAQIGRHLHQLGELPADEFDAMANLLMCSRFAMTINVLDELLAEEKFLAPEWASDLEKRRDLLRRVTDRTEFYIPTDVPSTSESSIQRGAQRIVADYGRLVEWWPAITERVIELRERGITIGRCVARQNG